MIDANVRRGAIRVTERPAPPPWRDPQHGDQRAAEPNCNALEQPVVLPRAVTTLGEPRLATAPPELDREREAVIVHRAKANDADAWSEIYNLYYRPVFRYFLGRIGDKTACEDLTAQVFLEAVKGIDSFVYRGTPFLAWLYRIARNVAADHHRRTLGRQQNGRSRSPWFFRRTSDRQPEVEPAAPDTTGDTINVERMDLKQAIDGLNDPQQEIIALHYYAGFSLREVARILDIEERRVYSLQAQALVALRRQLAG